MNISCLITLLSLYISSILAEQYVLDNKLDADAKFNEALSLLQAFEIEEQDFSPLDYGKLIRGEEIDQLPKMDLEVDFNVQYRKRKYEHLMTNLHEDQQNAIELLKEASELQHESATFFLADINMFGNFSIPRNGSLALKYYSRLTRITSDNSNAHFMLGFIYATGLFGEVEQNQAKSLIHYQASHELGDLRATMVLAYRYYQGISVEKNCELALFYYSTIAQRSLKYITDGPIGGPNIDSYSVRISDFSGGLYGARASEQSSSLTRAGSDHVYDRSIFNEINIDPEDHLSVQLFYEANAYYNADYFHKRDYNLAFAMANECAIKGEQIIKISNDVLVDKYFVSRCYSLVGHMYLRGEGTVQNYTEARKWLTKASEIISNMAYQSDLGLIYEYGLGMESPNPARAKLYYQKAEQETAAGKFHLARQLLAEQKLAAGFKKMQLAAYSGSEEALYHLSTLYERGIGGKKSCEDNVAAYKAFVERIEPVVSILEWSFKQLFCSRNNELALIGYAMAAEQGYESAQLSAGFLLYAPVPLSEPLPKIPKERYEAAMTYYSRSSKQFNIDSTVFLGDLYYYGALSPEPGNDSFAVPPDYKRAFHYYQDASNKHSKQGSFNLGYMYEMGLGVPKDYHLAKRYYDLALVGKSSELYLPVQLALIKLRFKMFWNRLIGGTGVEDDSQELKPKSRSWNDWKDLYKSIKRTNRAYLLDEVQENTPLQQILNEGGEITEDYDLMDSGIFDVILLFFILAIVGTLMYVHSRNRRRREERGNNEDENGRDIGGPPNFQFNFMIIPL